MSIDVDDIAPPSSNDAWKPEVGDVLAGVIVYADSFVSASYDGKKRERKLRLDVQRDDAESDPVTFYATMSTDVDDDDGYAKADAKAISTAVRAAGEKSLEVGGRIVIRRIDDKPTDSGAAKQWEAAYSAPEAGSTTSGDDDVASLLGKS